MVLGGEYEGKKKFDDENSRFLLDGVETIWVISSTMNQSGGGLLSDDKIIGTENSCVSLPLYASITLFSLPLLSSLNASVADGEHFVVLKLDPDGKKFDKGTASRARKRDLT
ncbi:unnamed protein product [Brassica rapa]|uniref:Uncharacterized protein n=2 Tax=Brassica TaxID=3705 RepID=A0A8D9HZX6_BRACM|nr:unnamed protein product [Brassica napus]CAG7908570.1 unnamed protein product [Brassica rapa]